MTVADFQAAFPVFADVDATEIQRHINAAAPWFNVLAWGDLYDQGLGNWVAHQIVTEANDRKAMSAKDGRRPWISGPGAREVIAETVDSVSIVYSAMLLNKQAADPYLRTIYGQRYRYLSGIAGGGAVAV